MTSQRRYDLDWIRVLVFALLIIFHTGMFFVPWDWHIKNNELSEAFFYPMWFLSQWRLPVLFLISGMGTRFALSKRSWKDYLKERNTRLIIPLIFGMVVVVAPQVYIERMVQGAAFSSFADFYPRYFNGVYPEGNFSWHHLWFLPYLFVYSVLLCPFFIRIRNHPGSKLMRGFKKILLQRYGILWLGLPLLAAELFLKPFFPVFQNLINDWYAFTRYLILFLYGFLFISAGDIFWRMLNRKKSPALITGITAFMLMVWMNKFQEWKTVYEVLFAVVTIVNLGAWSVAIFGYGAALLNRPGRVLAYCNQAVYPFYIIHQTITIAAAYFIYENSWPVFLKFLFLTAVTFGGSWLFYEVVKRFSFTRLLFGIKEKKVPLEKVIKPRSAAA